MIEMQSLSATASAMAKVPLADSAISKMPMGPFQRTVLALATPSLVTLDGLGTDIDPFPAVINIAFLDARLAELARTEIEGITDEIVFREEEFDALGRRFFEGSLGRFHLIRLSEAVPHFAPEGKAERCRPWPRQ
jgi:hypothetical protein